MIEKFQSHHRPSLVLAQTPKYHLVLTCDPSLSSCPPQSGLHLCRISMIPNCSPTINRCGAIHRRWLQLKFSCVRKYLVNSIFLFNYLLFLIRRLSRVIYPAVFKLFCKQENFSFLSVFFFTAKLLLFLVKFQVLPAIYSTSTGLMGQI